MIWTIPPSFSFKEYIVLICIVDICQFCLYGQIFFHLLITKFIKPFGDFTRRRIHAKHSRSIDLLSLLQVHLQRNFMQFSKWNVYQPHQIILAFGDFSLSFGSTTPVLPTCRSRELKSLRWQVALLVMVTVAM